MRIILSRKGFDSAAGGGPSPIVAGRPVTLPIPDDRGLSRTTYGALGLGELVTRASRGRYGPDSPCHHDPMFLPDGTGVFGQCGGPLTHLLRTESVGAGDVFLFFGWFAGDGWPDHHRIFGYLRVAEIVHLAQTDAATLARFDAIDHPHALGFHHASRNDALFVGPARKAGHASQGLCLTEPGQTRTRWLVPPWLRVVGLSCHRDERRWPAPGRLVSVAQGQEFVADIGDAPEPRRWLDAVIAEIERP